MVSRTTAWALGLLIAVCGAGCIDDAWAQHAPDAGPPADTGLVLGALWGDTIGDSFGAGALGRTGRTGRNPPLPRDAGTVGTIGLIGRGGGPGGNSSGRGWGRLNLRRDAGVPAR